MYIIYRMSKIIFIYEYIKYIYKSIHPFFVVCGYLWDVWDLFPPHPGINVKVPFQGKNMETTCFQMFF